METALTFTLSRPATLPFSDHRESAFIGAANPDTLKSGVQPMATIRFTLNGKPQTVDVIPAMPLLWVLRDTIGLTGTKFGCGMAHLRRLHRPCRRAAMRSCVTSGCRCRRQERHHHRRPLARWLAPRPEGLDRKGRPPVRLLPVRPDHGRRRAAREKRQTHRRRYRRGHAQQHLPLRNLSGHPRRHPRAAELQAKGGVA